MDDCESWICAQLSVHDLFLILRDRRAILAAEAWIKQSLDTRVRSFKSLKSYEQAISFQTTIKNSLAEFWIIHEVVIGANKSPFFQGSYCPIKVDRALYMIKFNLAEHALWKINKKSRNLQHYPNLEYGH